MLLAVSGARKIEKKDLPQLFNVVEEMTLASGLPKMPDVYVIDDPQPNAFATGRNPENAAVAATTGLLVGLSATDGECIGLGRIEPVAAVDLLHQRRDGRRVGVGGECAGCNEHGGG